MASYKLTKPAESDLLSIWRYIAEDNPQAADSVLDLIEAHFSQLSRNPKIGRLRKDLAENLFSFVAGKSNWRSQFIIFYRMHGDGIDIIRVLEGHRDIDEGYF